MEKKDYQLLIYISFLIELFYNELSLKNNKKLINGCANITGGGLKDNVKRILPSHLSANIDLDKIKTK